MTQHTDAQYEPTYDQKKRIAFHKSVVDNADALKATTQGAELGKAIKNTANYLYAIEDSTIVGDIDPELFKEISMLRQLLNECFVHEKKSVSNQFLYDQFKPLISTQREQARQEVLDELEAVLRGNEDDHFGTNHEGVTDDLIDFINAKRKKGDTDDQKEK